MEKSSRCCHAFDLALRDGFLVERDGIRLADLIARGPEGSHYASRTYGPAIAFCPFCGEALAAPPH